MDGFVRGTILFGFISLLTWLIMTDQLSLYINPNFSILVQLSCFLLLPMLSIQVLDVLVPARSITEHHVHTPRRYWTYIPFLAILILAFALPDNTLNANLVTTRGLNSQLNTVVTSQQDLPRPLAAEFSQMSAIPVTDLNYTEAVSEMTTFPKEYLGKKVTMTGFVFRSPGLKSNQLSLVRYVIVCCTSDTLPYGLMCEVPDAQKYPEGSWLTIEGVLQMSTFEDRDVPAIKVTSAKSIDKPKNPYIFPYN
jgi:putative membrane protein